MYTRGKRNPNDQPKEGREKKKKKKKKKILSLSLSLREHGDLRLSLSLSLYLSDTKRRYADALFFPTKNGEKWGKNLTQKERKAHYDVGKKRRSADVVDRRWCRDSSREVLVFFALFDQREVFFSSLFSSERCFFIIFFW